MLKWRGKRILVVGAARSGVAVVKVLLSYGSKVALYDGKTEEQLRGELVPLTRLNYDKYFGKEPDVAHDFDLIIVSPGVPLSIPVIISAYAAGIPIWGEIELAYIFAKGDIIAITGTNGKTTTTALVGQIFRDAGKSSRMGGNIGNPLIMEATEGKRDELLIAEVSSFQLETISEFKPKGAAILNLTPDHLDRHGNMENYLDAKSRIYENQSTNDFLVLNYDDEKIRRLDIDRPRKIYFSRRQEVHGVYVKDGVMYANFRGQEERIISIKDIKIPGGHNLENALAATALALAMDVPAYSIAHTLRTFSGVPHRLEFVTEKNGVQFINDSKGTNPDSTIKALEAYPGPIILIAGGKNKGSNFHELSLKIKEKVKYLILVGKASTEIASAVEEVGFKNYIIVDEFSETVQVAANHSEVGDIVLLSPACASWDMFENYEQRGNLFKELVLHLGR